LSCQHSSLYHYLIEPANTYISILHGLASNLKCTQRYRS